MAERCNSTRDAIAGLYFIHLLSSREIPASIANILGLAGFGAFHLQSGRVAEHLLCCLDKALICSNNINDHIWHMQSKYALLQLFSFSPHIVDSAFLVTFCEVKHLRAYIRCGCSLHLGCLFCGIFICWENVYMFTLVCRVD